MLKDKIMTKLLSNVQGKVRTDTCFGSKHFRFILRDEPSSFAVVMFAKGKAHARAIAIDQGYDVGTVAHEISYDMADAANGRANYTVLHAYTLGY